MVRCIQLVYLLIYSLIVPLLLYYLCVHLRVVRRERREAVVHLARHPCVGDLADEFHLGRGGLHRLFDHVQELLRVGEGGGKLVLRTTHCSHVLLIRYYSHLPQLTCTTDY
jgi:AraC-like DNA-binding protein